MAAQSLVLCRDPEVLGMLRQLLAELNIGVEICLGLSSAKSLLQGREFDTVIVECDADGAGLEILQRLRSEQASPNTIAVGIVDDHNVMRAAFASGANFVLSKPLSVEDAKRVLKVTKGLITRMVRRFLRVAVHHLAHVSLAGLSEPAFLLDLSEGGMAVQAFESLAVGQTMKVSFILPGTETPIAETARVVWADPSGRAGLEFPELTDMHRAMLKQWVLQWVRTQGDQPPTIAPPAPTGLPDRVPLAKKWMRPLARAVDAAFVVIATVLFCLIASRFVTTEDLRLAAAGALLALGFAGAAYAWIFRALKVPFPGGKAIELLLASTTDHAAHSV